MQAELLAGITILGVNEAGYESGNASITEGRSLPWLQDTSEVNVWTQWAVTYRDVLVRDREGLLFGVFNLTGHGLGETENYEDLKALALGAAEE
jgi:hypothetical protein